jgi:hypothetical protein
MATGKTLWTKDGNGKRVKLDSVIERMFYTHCSGVPIPILSIGKIFDAGRLAFLAGGDESAIKAAVLAAVDAVKV